MGSRRKLKSERELVADIHKTFKQFCWSMDCKNCPYKDSKNCTVDYTVDLLKKNYALSNEDEK